MTKINMGVKINHFENVSSDFSTDFQLSNFSASDEFPAVNKTWAYKISWVSIYN